MKTGKITAITPNGSWSNGSKTFNRYNVSMADGNIYQFNAIGEFKHQVGEECQFTSEQKEYNGQIYNTAKLVRPNPMQGGFNSTQPKSNDTQELIVRQSCLTNAVNFLKDKEGMTWEDINELHSYFVKLIYKN